MATRRAEAGMEEGQRVAAAIRMFPIQGGPAIPWATIAPHEHQAQNNHGQSLERLAQRGGLCPSEAVAVLESRDWSSMDDAAALARLRDIVVVDVWRIVAQRDARIAHLEEDREAFEAELDMAHRALVQSNQARRGEKLHKAIERLAGSAKQVVVCGQYLGDNDGTCPQLTCIRDRGHEGACDNLDGGDAVPDSSAAASCAHETPEDVVYDEQGFIERVARWCPACGAIRYPDSGEWRRIGGF